MKACVNHRHPCLVKSDRFCNEHDTDVKRADREMSRAWAGHPCKYLICPSPGETSKATSKLAPFSKGVTQGKRALQIESSSGCAKAKVLTNSQNWGASQRLTQITLRWTILGPPGVPQNALILKERGSWWFYWLPQSNPFNLSYDGRNALQWAH